jgi:hypothetical protein
VRILQPWHGLAAAFGDWLERQSSGRRPTRGTQRRRYPVGDHAGILRREVCRGTSLGGLLHPGGTFVRPPMFGAGLRLSRQANLATFLQNRWCENSDSNTRRSQELVVRGPVCDTRATRLVVGGKGKRFVFGGMCHSDEYDPTGSMELTGKVSLRQTRRFWRPRRWPRRFLQNVSPITIR